MEAVQQQPCVEIQTQAVLEEDASATKDITPGMEVVVRN